MIDLARRMSDRVAAGFATLGPEWLPFADAGSKELPMARLVRLSLFQLSVGMAVVLLIGTLNRVMIVELGIPASVVATMIALPLLFAPARALIGFRSDEHKSYLGLRRLPYFAFGTMMQFGGFAIMPMALILLSGDRTVGPEWAGTVSAALAFLLVGAGVHTTQTAGLALATDLAPKDLRPKVVAFLCAMMLVGMFFSALIFGLVLREFSPIRLIQVVQGAALATLVINSIAIWQQEPRNSARTRHDRVRPAFDQTWQAYVARPRNRRRLVALALGTAAFSMQDVLLEPFGGQVLGLSVSGTTLLGAAMAAGGIAGLAVAARRLGAGADPYRVAGQGALFGLAGFSSVIFSVPLLSPSLHGIGVTLIGYGGGLFAHATMSAAMADARADESGFVLGVWGSVQATAAGVAVATGGLVRDLAGGLAEAGRLGEALTGPATGYVLVYHIELVLLFMTLVSIGPLVASLVAENAATRRAAPRAGGATTAPPLDHAHPSN